MERIGAVVIGAGVVGLACARTLAQRGIDTVILEQHDKFGSETSARNSEVIHAGIYYPTGSLKAERCVAGRHLLYAFCVSHGVSHRRCGKLVVVTSTAQESRLHALLRQGENNGVDDLQLIGAADARALEPGIRCNAALLSPSTGIVDSHGLMLALLGDAERAGATLALRSPLRAGTLPAKAGKPSTGAGHKFTAIHAHANPLRPLYQHRDRHGVNLNSWSRLSLANGHQQGTNSAHGSPSRNLRILTT